MKTAVSTMVAASHRDERKEVFVRALTIGLMASLAALIVLFGSIVQAKAEVSVNIGINAPFPPVYVVPAPPPVVVIPGTYVYFAPGLDVDILFYHGYWYRPHGDRWYRSRSYNGPWGFVTNQRIPRALVTLPPHYRDVHPGRSHIPHGQLKKNWGRWERERYWHKHPEWRHGKGGHRADPGPERHNRDRRGRGYDHRGPEGHGGR